MRLLCVLRIFFGNTPKAISENSKNMCKKKKQKTKNKKNTDKNTKTYQKHKKIPKHQTKQQKKHKYIYIYIFRTFRKKWPCFPGVSDSFFFFFLVFWYSLFVFLSFLSFLIFLAFFDSFCYVFVCGNSRTSDSSPNYTR